MTLTGAGVVQQNPAGETLSQLPPVEVLATAEKTRKDLRGKKKTCFDGKQYQVASLYS